MTNKKLNKKTCEGEYMMKKSTKGIFLMLVATILIVSLVPAISFATNTKIAEKTDTSSIKITSKSKTASYKITWNGNGGKIGTKKTVSTTVKKGFKIAKLATNPKRSGYTFKGWYTKKTGGTKITKNTKPNKSVTYYAKWSKNRVLSATEKKLVGKWGYGFNTHNWVDATTGNWEDFSSSGSGWDFKDDGTYTYLQFGFGSSYTYPGVFWRNGDYRVEGNTIHLTNTLGRYDPVGGDLSDAYSDRPYLDNKIPFKFENDGKLTITDISAHTFTKVNK